MEYLVVLHKTKRMLLFHVHLLYGMDAHDPGKATHKVQYLAMAALHVRLYVQYPKTF